IDMINDGCLDGVDVIFGAHLWATDPFGTVLTKPGPLMAAADKFEIEIQGQGGHGGSPHTTKDAIVIGSQLVLNLQQIISRRINPQDPAVISVGSFEAINAVNVIADRAKLTGTVRTCNETTRALIEKEIDRIARGTCFQADAMYKYTYSRGYPTLINDEKMAEYIMNVAEQVPGVTDVQLAEPHMGAEDFSYYLQHVPGAFFF